MTECIRKVFECACGTTHYLEVWRYDWDDDEPVRHSIVVVEWPSTFWQRFRWLFLGGRSISHEILLTPEQVAGVREVLAWLATPCGNEQSATTPTPRASTASTASSYMSTASNNQG